MPFWSVIASTLCCRLVSAADAISMQLVGSYSNIEALSAQSMACLMTQQGLSTLHVHAQHLQGRSNMSLSNTTFQLWLSLPNDKPSLASYHVKTAAEAYQIANCCHQAVLERAECLLVRNSLAPLLQFLWMLA